jgi:hypothetical protein
MLPTDFKNATKLVKLEGFIVNDESIIQLIPLFQNFNKNVSSIGGPTSTKTF